MNASHDYVGTLRRWSGDVFREPGAWLGMSAMFLVCSLPVVTWGCSWTLLAVYAKEHEEGKKIKFLKEFKTFLSTKTALFGLIFGLSDIAFALAFAFSLGALLDGDAGAVSRFFSCLLLWIDVLYLMSGIYRYPLLAERRDAPLFATLSEGVLLTLSNLPNVILIFMVGVCIAMVSALAGIFLLAFFPGALALLHRYNMAE